ncbi:MAG: hypothetical protein EP298_00535 [Gammaproteobacteria bacterium]|nr:MAG: hypothetical protein EP298_00535 [Gammaproteobacteria bacterium]UTW41894.1 hypothetical protein KFE69_10320 [bacterium SCSIO 12844]
MDLFEMLKEYFNTYALYETKDLRENNIDYNEKLKNITIHDFQKDVQAFFHKYGLGSKKMNYLIDNPSNNMKRIQGLPLNEENLKKLGDLEDIELKPLKPKNETWGDSLANHFPKRRHAVKIFFPFISESEKSINENINDKMKTALHDIGE